jgi:hypothetical protein
MEYRISDEDAVIKSLFSIDSTTGVLNHITIPIPEFSSTDPVGLAGVKTGALSLISRGLI